MTDKTDSKWLLFTRRTKEPKLSWLERQLDEADIPHQRNGMSVDAPILEVASERLEAAWAILEPVVDIPDDDPRWEEDKGK